MTGLKTLRAAGEPMQSRAPDAVWRLAFGLIGSAAYFVAASLVGLLTLVALFQAGLFSGLSVLFYRGLVLNALTAGLVLVGVLWWVARTPGWTIRDAMSAAAVVFCVNLNVLTLGPVTIDRSISVFILGTMAQNPVKGLAAADVDQVFRDVYLTDFNQIERRMQEQAATGTVQRRADGTYVITPQGERFVATARRIASLFGIDPRIVVPRRLVQP
jgi:hypothetical protein